MKQISLLLLWLSPVASFISAPRAPASWVKQQSVRLAAESNVEAKAKDLLPGALVEDFELLPHRPLGMTIEESLADNKFVLVTKVVEGGNAEKAGIEVGDVMVGVTGLFGDLTNCIGLDIKKMCVCVC